jgi:LmbE family N-acetylglucosaminyl deacetylase
MIRKDNIRQLFSLSQRVKNHFADLVMTDKPDGSRVMVLAPHPDDDVFGCGGTIRLHRHMGHPVSIVYLSDGEQGIQKLDARQTIHLRNQEARQGAKILGVEEEQLYYLHLKDRDLIHHAGSNQEFRDLLEFIHPDIIYLPSFLESHRDHFASNVLLKNNLIHEVIIAAYEIWTPLIANKLIDISPVIEEKRMAMMAHHSQLQRLNYVDALLSLNRYRAAMNRKEARYAEAFFNCPSSQYFELMMSVE